MSQTTTLSDPADRVSESELVARLRGGERAAFRALYDRHWREVLGLLRRLLPADDVADAAQETFVRLHRGLQRSFDPSAALRPYLLQIARNVAIECLRRLEQRARVAPLDGELPDARLPEHAALLSERDALIHRGLQALTPELRAALLLRYSHGLTQVEIAAAQGCSERTVRNRLRDAAQLLERELRRLGLDAPHEESL